LETWANAHQQSAFLSRLLFAPVLGLLVPLPGTILIVAGESFLVFRLFLRNHARAATPHSIFPVQAPKPKWGEAFRQSAAKWGFAASMIAFTWTLRDRVAEIGAAASFLVWAALNISRFLQPQDS
jgi:hypothetical protein